MSRGAVLQGEGSGRCSGGGRCASEERGEESLESRWAAIVDKLFAAPSEDVLEEQLERELDELMGLYGEGDEVDVGNDENDKKSILITNEKSTPANKDEHVTINNDIPITTTNDTSITTHTNKSTHNTNQSTHLVHSSLNTPLSIYAILPNTRSPTPTISKSGSKSILLPFRSTQ